MENKEGNTDNELIAEFMKISEVTQYFDSYGKQSPIYWTQNDYFRTRTYDLPNISMKEFLQQSKYDTSWDWLMPVVEKIQAVERIGVMIAFDSSNGFTQCEIYQTKGLTEGIDNADKSPIKAVYKSVVEFIKWYNSNGK